MTPGLIAFVLALAPATHGPGSPASSRARQPRPAGTRAAPHDPQPLAAVAGPYRVYVERVVQNASLTLDFAAADATAPAEGKETVYVHLLVVGPDSDRAGALVGLGSNLVAKTDAGQSVPLRAYSGSEGGLADGKSVRVCLLAQDVDVNARQLRVVDGELMAFPRSRGVRLEFSPGGRLPQTRTEEGLQVTLEEFKIENGEATAMLSQRWPQGATISRLRPEIPFGAIALSSAGVPSYPSAERSETLEKPEGEQSRRFRLVFPDLKQLPQKLAIEVLVRSGTPESIPFRLNGLPLRDEGVRSADDPDTSPPAGLPAGNPDLVPKGGAPLALSVRVEGQPAGEGTLLVGLKQAGATNAPCRWLSLATDAAGKAELPNLRPGRYSATLRWTPRPGAVQLAARSGAWTNDQAEFTAVAGKPITLPALEWREK